MGNGECDLTLDPVSGYISFWPGVFICLLAFVSGNTYDRSIEVDEEEASILLYDIWEQVRHRMQFHFDPQKIGLGHSISFDVMCSALMLV